MKEALLSTCEKNFINKAICDSLRLDGRSLDEFRSLQIHLGSEWGSVYVCLGETRVLAQVTCQVVQPKSVRPNEGLLFINVELGPMAASHFEAGRSSEPQVQINRILERAFKDSRCVDLESLCIVAEEKVWSLRVDINVLNHDGNVIDAASVACLTALAHFRRPDVTTSGDEVIIHTLAEKDPIGTVLHHYPVCVSYGIFNRGKLAVADPTAVEERVAEAAMVFGINSYRELCGLHLGGITLTSPQLLLRCADKGAKRAKMMVDLIKETLAKDVEARVEGRAVSFTEVIRTDRVNALAERRLPIQLKKFKLKVESEQMETQEEEEEEEDSKIMQIEANSAVLMDQKGASWVAESEDESSEADEGIVDASQTKKSPKKESKVTIESSDSEEDVVMTVTGETLVT